MPLKRYLLQLLICELIFLLIFPSDAYLQSIHPTTNQITDSKSIISQSSSNTHQPEQFFIQQLNNRNGLSNSSINHIFKDADNIIWIATWDGLNMYDGTSFHVFNYGKENDSKSIGSNVIMHITEDKNENIWISTIEGISKFEKRTGKFHNYFYSQNQRNSISEQEYELVVDKMGSVFCLASGIGLYNYDSIADIFRLCPMRGSSAKIAHLAFDAFNRLWTVNENGELQSFEHSGHDLRLIKSIQSNNNRINHFFQTNDRLFFSSVNNQLWEINNRTLEHKMVMQMKHAITAVVYYKNHYLFVGYQRVRSL